MRLGRFGRAAALVALALGFGTAARADGYPPFYGYSPYYGGPATYFTPDNDVRQATAEKDGSWGFGTRTYYRGGPYWHWQANRPGLRTYSRTSRRWRRGHRGAVLRRRD